jgi:hypothetical protein
MCFQLKTYLAFAGSNCSSWKYLGLVHRVSEDMYYDRIRTADASSQDAFDFFSGMLDQN